MESRPIRIGCVVMAAGSAARFGENKLFAKYRGKALFLRALDALPEDLLPRTVLVTRYDAVEAEARSRGCQVIRNLRPDLGVSHTVALGTDFLSDSCDGILYLVSDQPLLRRETVQLLLNAFLAHPDQIIIPAHGETQGNPCVFPKDLFPALRALRGDRGGKQIIRQHPDRVLLVAVPAEELYDVDTVQELDALNQ